MPWYGTGRRVLSGVKANKVASDKLPIKSNAISDITRIFSNTMLGLV